MPVWTDNMTRGVMLTGAHRVLLRDSSDPRCLFWNAA